MPMGVLAVVALNASLSFGDVELRGKQGKVPGEIESVSMAGVVVKLPATSGAGTGQGSRVIVGWDAVRPGLVIPESVTKRDQGATPEKIKELWRSVARIERDDLAGAEPLLEELFELTLNGNASGAAGPTNAVVADGVLRCRLSRGASTSAIFAYFEWIRAARMGPPAVGGIWSVPSASSTPMPGWIGGSIVGRSVVAEGNGLVPTLPPIFVGETSTAAAADSKLWARYIGEQKDQASAGKDATDGDRSLEELAGWYRAAMRFESGEGVDRPKMVGGAVSTHEGVRLVRDIVIARIGDAQERDAARAALRSRIDRPRENAAEWEEAWCRAGLGRSLLQEESPESKRQGVLELLYVPARFSRECPGLSGIALADAAVGIDALGDQYSARVLAKELRARFPDHAAQSWEPLRRILNP